MATIFRSPVLVTVYKLPKAQPEYTVNLRTLYAPNPDRPFRQLDWPLAARPKPPQDAAAPANRNPLIYPNPSRPFHQDGWDRPTSARPQATGEADGTQNPLLTPNPTAPFSQSEWRLTARVQLSLKSDSYWGAFPLYSPNPSAPFRQQLWDSAAKTPPKAVGEAVARTAALLAPNPAQPFVPADWSRTLVVYKATVDDVANLLPVQTVVGTIAPPFVQGDWPNPSVANRGVDLLSWVNQFSIQLNFPSEIIPDVVPETTRPEVWWPVTKNLREEKREADRAAALAEMMAELEQKRTTDELKAIAQRAAALAGQEETKAERDTYRRFLKSLRKAQNAPLTDESAQRIALQIGTQLANQMMARLDDEDATIALLLSD